MPPTMLFSIDRGASCSMTYHSLLGIGLQTAIAVFSTSVVIIVAAIKDGGVHGLGHVRGG